MKLIKRLLGLSYFTLWIGVLCSVTAFAYLDPGTLTYVVSMVAALFIAGGAALAIFRRRVKLFFQNLGKKKSGTETAPAADDLGDEINPMDDVVDPLAGDKD